MKWHTETRKISELKNWESNPRTISEKEFKKLKSSIDDLGNFEPLVINTDGTVLAGNQRLRVHIERGDNEVEVSVPERELTEQEIKKIGLISNRHSGEWDMDKLANEFEDVLEELGFDDLMTEVAIEVEEDDYEEPEDLEVRVKLGEVWQLGKHRLMCGDSSKIEDVEKLMDGQKADMVFTDPPYGIDVVSGTIGGDKPFGTADSSKVVKANEYPEIIGDATTDTAREIYALISSMKIRTIAMWGGNYFTDFLPPSRGWLIWDKKGKEWEDNFSDCEMMWTNREIPTKIVRYQFMGMVQEGKREKRVHPTQKPVAMIAKCFEYLEGRNVLDLFGGSGSTLIACEQTNRKCYMMELDEHYCTVILDRWEKLTGEKAIKLEG